jgi:DNA-binding MarR family transcriptional regulator
MVEGSALPTLLWAVLKMLERAYAEEGSLGPKMPSLDLWANLLRGLNEAGIDIRELPRILRLSKRAVRSRVATAVRHGWVERVKSGRGQAMLRLTPSGSEAAAQWKSLQEAAEKCWRTNVGVRADQLRTCLEHIVSRLLLEHPHYPASYGAADASITGGDGQDWKGVPRVRGSDLSKLPLSALLSQALVAFAIEYEKKSPVALSLSTAVIKRIPANGRTLRELGNSVGISALVRHGFLRLSDGATTAVVFLTSRGLTVSKAYDEKVQAVEREWRHRFGSENVRKLRELLEELTKTNPPKTTNQGSGSCAEVR